MTTDEIEAAALSWYTEHVENVYPAVSVFTREWILRAWRAAVAWKAENAQPTQANPQLYP